MGTHTRACHLWCLSSRDGCGAALHKVLQAGPLGEGETDRQMRGAFGRRSDLCGEIGARRADCWCCNGEVGHVECVGGELVLEAESDGRRGVSRGRGRLRWPSFFSDGRMLILLHSFSHSFIHLVEEMVD